MDVDFMMTEANFEKAEPFFKEAGYSEVMKQHLYARLKRGGAEPDPAGGLFMDIDILFTEPSTFERIFIEAREAEIRGAKIKVISLDHLMAMKLHSLKNNPEGRRDPDLTDLVRLIQINKVNAESDFFREFCRKYGTQEIYDNIVQKVKLWKT